MVGRGAAWVVAALVGLAVAAALFVLLGFVWQVRWGDGYECGPLFNPVPDDGWAEECDEARTKKAFVELFIAVFCGFVAAAVTLGVLGRHTRTEPLIRHWG